MSEQAAQRFLDALRDHKLRCLDCGENLTLVERLHARSYCADCWPEELEFNEEIS